MSKILIEQPHALLIEGAKVQLSSLCATLSERYGIESRWISNTEVWLSRTGIAGSLQIEAQRVQIQLELSFALAPLKARIERTIRTELESLSGERIPELKPVA